MISAEVGLPPRGTPYPSSKGHFVRQQADKLRLLGPAQQAMHTFETATEGVPGPGKRRTLHSQCVGRVVVSWHLVCCNEKNGWLS